MGIGDFADKAKEFAGQHDEQVDQGLERVGDEASERLGGHEGQVDALVDKAQQSTGEGDTTAAATDAVPDAPAEGSEVPPQ
jgi:antitoxin protein of toxin-antitoxin system